jgi:3',5'-cyclic AMP phosphodiesterase CpdA
MSFTIAHLTDVHLGPLARPRLAELRLKRFMGYINWKRTRERLSDMPALTRLVVDMHAQSPDHVAVTGDLVNIGLPSEFRRAAVWMRTLGEPADVSFTPGNHDAYVREAMPFLAGAFTPWTQGDAEFARGETFPFVRVRGEVALIGLSTATPTGPLMATGRLGARQIQALAAILQETGAKNLARVILIHHPPLSRGGGPLRSLTDAPSLEAAVARYGAEAILHGHTHKRMIHRLASPATRVEGGRIPILGAPSASSASADPRQRAAYHLVRFERAGEHWRVQVRARGLQLGGAEIGERESPAP